MKEENNDIDVDDNKTVLEDDINQVLFGSWTKQSMYYSFFRLK